MTEPFVSSGCRATIPIVLTTSEVVLNPDRSRNDLEGVGHNCPNQYKNKVQSGEEFVYHRGVHRKSGARGQPEYFGRGRIGEGRPDPATAGPSRRSWFAGHARASPSPRQWPDISSAPIEASRTCLSPQMGLAPQKGNLLTARRSLYHLSCLLDSDSDLSEMCPHDGCGLILLS